MAMFPHIAYHFQRTLKLSIIGTRALVQEGKEVASMLYTHRNCVKEPPQPPDSMKQSQTDPYLEKYQVLDLGTNRFHDIQRW
ncbi:hypothetical protein K1719_020477 [Acacia pycnantha]|nr:hypothetical protein K1719_020477 [Acacia pycnantha]